MAMEEQLSKETLAYPIRTNTLSIPQEHDLLLTYDVYKPSTETRKMNAEKGRNIFAEAFIEENKLGLLSDLSIRAIAQAYDGKDILSLVSNDPVKSRIFYESLSVDLPLQQCYHIADDKYWRRVVLAKTDKKSLIFEKAYNWKSLGTSIKYVELVEACPVEYWPEEEMHILAMKIKDYVKEMHIRRLQTQLDRTFEQYFLSESDLSDSDESNSTDVLSLSPEEEEKEAEEANVEEGKQNEEKDKLDGEMANGETMEIIKTEEELETERVMQREVARKRESTRDRREKQRALKEAQIKRREKREYFQKRREAKKPPPSPPPQPESKKKKKHKPKGIFDIEVEPEEPEEGLSILDRRNMEKVLRGRKKQKYLPEFCHHIDLQFIRFFEHMETFTIEFQGPKLNREYHTKHSFFSYTDIENLAFGLDFLRLLKIFRLRNSRMDATKLMTIARALKNLEHLEIVDFGFDQLHDDCGHALRALFRHTDSIKSLELEGNLIGRESLASLGEALSNYDGVLEYLGLAGNMLQNDALHEFNQHIIGTNQIHNLNIRGAFLTQEAIICCIADELLRKHPVLKYLGISAIDMDEATATEVINALETNKVIQDFECRECNMPFEIERDINVILERNRYIVKHSYLGNETKREEEINEYANRIKNPSLVNAYAAIEEQAECRRYQLDETQRSSELSESEIEAVSAQPYMSMISLPRPTSISKISIAYEGLNSRYNLKVRDTAPFHYDTNNFDEEEFRAHVYLPGPAERYYYFLEEKQRDLPRD